MKLSEIFEKQINLLVTGDKDGPHWENQLDCVLASQEVVGATS
jgi:hypothetical protein